MHAALGSDFRARWSTEINESKFHRRLMRGPCDLDFLEDTAIEDDIKPTKKNNKVSKIAASSKHTSKSFRKKKEMKQITEKKKN